MRCMKFFLFFVHHFFKKIFCEKKTEKIIEEKKLKSFLFCIDPFFIFFHPVFFLAKIFGNGYKISQDEKNLLLRF